MEKLKEKIMKQLTLLGKSMLIPIVILPLTAILGSIFDPTILNVPVIANVRDVLFENMDYLFAMGAAVAYSKTKDKTYVLVASVMGFMMFKSNLNLINDTLDMGVFGGILFGILTAVLYNYSRKWRIPAIFSFFGGDKMIITLIPIVSIALSVIMGSVWEYPQLWLENLSIWVSGTGLFGIFFFVAAQRLLIPTGLHHVLNAYFLFELGTYTAANGEVVRGLIPRFLAGDVTAGYYLSGVALVFFFAIPAITLAMYHTSYAKNKEEVKSAMTSGALTSVLAGVSEPVEFSFMFISPKLYVFYSLIVGLGAVVLAALGVSNAGVQRLIELIFLWNMGRRVWITFPVGIVVAIIVYFVFKYVIVKEDLQTPGRERSDTSQVSTLTSEKEMDTLVISDYTRRAQKIYQALGEKRNISSIENCMTRLRVEVKEMDKVEEEELRRQGAKAVMKTTSNDLQIIIGTEVAHIFKNIEKIMDESDDE